MAQELPDTVRMRAAIGSRLGLAGLGSGARAAVAAAGGGAYAQFYAAAEKQSRMLSGLRRCLDVAQPTSPNFRLSPTGTRRLMAFKGEWRLHKE